MGLQATQTDNGASILVIDQPCDNDQLLVSLSKNGSQWLSPIGWTNQQKVTLLDCRANGTTTEIDVPAEFAKDIISGDVLVLRCSELDLEKEIIWEASEVTVRHTPEVATTTTGLAGGLLSRFKGSKTEAVDITKTEAQLRAEEADRAAQTYKAKMEAATQAKEQAQKKALDAAREAEAALKMEAERIAEMERAAKAFEEAERLKQDEMRRVEEERRAEEARLAEEARRLEEARLREIAAKKEAERKAALERYSAALDITRNEELRLKARLKELKNQAKTEAANNAAQADDLKSRRRFLISTEDAANKNAARYNQSALKLDAGSAKLAIFQTEAEELTTQREAMSAQVAQADTDYQQAQKEAEAAIARAESMRAKLDEARAAEGELSSRMGTMSEKLSKQTLVTNDLTLKADKLKAKSEMAQAELAQAKTEIDAIEQSLAAQAEKEQGLRLEIEATQQAIEDSQARELSHRDAIDHLEAGGSPEDITEIDFEARDYTPVTTFAGTATRDTAASKASGLMGRVRSKFAREKDAEISIAVEDVVMDTPEAAILEVPSERPSFMRRHSSSLMALGAVLGGVAILGGGFALNKSAAPTLEVKAKAPAPTQVANAVTRVELPKIETADAPVAEAQPTVEKETKSVDLPDDVAETIAPKLEAIETVAPKAEETEFKYADVVDPVGFAFELPDMAPKKVAKPKASPAPKAVKKAEATPVIKTEKLNKPAAEKAVISKPTVVENKPEERVNYPELTKDIQTRLSSLGFYTGAIDGLQGDETKEAIKTFKTLFSLTADDKITGELLTELKRAEREQEAARLIQQAQAEAALEAEATANVQFAEAAPTVEFFDTVQAVPTTPVVTDSLPATTPYQPQPVTVTPEPVIVEAPEPEPVKVASLPTRPAPEPTPVIQDVIKEAKLLKNAGASYPKVAQRRDYFVNVEIVVSYDIDATGLATNLKIASNDHTGRYNEAFEAEAMKAIEKLRYDPKTVNGEAVITTGKQKRIVFRVE